MQEGMYTLADAAPEGSSLMSTFIMFGLILLVFWLLFWRPNQKRRRQETQMQSSLGPGTEVMTKAGIFGTVVEIHDDDLLLEIAPGTRVRMLKAGIAQINSPQVDDTPVEDRPDFGDDDKPKD